jgi:deoxyadenosine/deoxycytidine kinase
MVLLISIEGNIGAGKSTIINQLIKENLDPQIIILQEPVDMWESVKHEGETMLQKFYNDQDKYAFAFQIMAFTTRLKLIQDTINQNPDAKIILCERSLEADREIFAKMLNKDGVIEPILYQIYEMYFQDSVDTMYQLSGMIYLNTPPDVCSKRIVKRNRDGESNIPLSYLIKCDNYHKLWMEKFSKPIYYQETDSSSINTYPVFQFLQQTLNHYSVKPSTV